MTRLILLSAFLFCLQEIMAQTNFSRDEGRHPDANTEVWSIYGHFVNEEKQDIGIIVSLFSGKYLFFTGNVAFFGVTDQSKKIFRSDDKFFIPLLSSVNHTEGKLHEDFGGNVLSKTNDGNYTLSMEMNDFKLSIKFKPIKEHLVMVHDTGRQSEDKPRKHFLPRCEASGILDLGKGQNTEITGAISFDHYWGPSMEEDHDIFIVQLSDSTDLYFFFKHDEKGGGPLHGSVAYISPLSGPHTRDDNYRLTTTGWWEDKGKQKKYPNGWHIEVPTQKIDLELHPSIPDQEASIMGMTWWSGTAMVSGKISEKQVSGKAWVILHGYKQEAP